MNVPAWPMPIHQTKFTIANPHATGILTPQIPTPFSNSQPMAKFISRSKAKAMANPPSQPLVTGRLSTISLIFRVTDSLLYPGATTGSLSCLLMLCPAPRLDWLTSPDRSFAGACLILAIMHSSAARLSALLPGCSGH